jgi:hypothetical protein
MAPLDVDSSVLVVIAVLVSLSRLVRVFFATLRICIWEYRDFREWLAAVRRQRKSGRTTANARNP